MNARQKELWLFRAACALGLFILPATTARGVQPLPGGVSIQWDRLTNDLSFSIYRQIPATTNWLFVSSTTNAVFIYTNTVLEGTMFGVTSLQNRSNGTCCVAVDVGVAGWPPALNTPPKSLRLTPINGYLVATGQWVKVSSDLSAFDDWLRFTPAGSGVRVEHRSSALKPKLFMAYPTNPAPPLLPGGGKP